MRFFVGTVLLLAGSGAGAQPAQPGGESDLVRTSVDMTVSGTISDVLEDRAFELETASGVLTVDTQDHWPFLFDGEGREIEEGELVTVRAGLDDNYFSNRTLDAYQLTISGEMTNTIYRSGVVANDVETDLGRREPEWVDEYNFEEVVLSGIVAEVSGNGEIRLDHNDGEIRVNTEDLDMPARSELGVGDRVAFRGEIGDAWFDRQEFDASAALLTNVYSVAQ